MFGLLLDRRASSLDGVGGPPLFAAGARLAELGDELAVLGELQDLGVVGAVAADPDIALIVHEDAVVGFRPVIARTGAAPGVEEIARFVEFQNRRRGLAASALTMLQLAYGAVDGLGAMNHPDMIVIVDIDTDRHAHHPMMGQRLGPIRVHFELRRHLLSGLRLCRSRVLECKLADTQRGDHDSESGTNQKISGADQTSHTFPPAGGRAI